MSSAMLRRIRLAAIENGAPADLPEIGPDWRVARQEEGRTYVYNPSRHPPDFAGEKAYLDTSIEVEVDERRFIVAWDPALAFSIGWLEAGGEEMEG